MLNVTLASILWNALVAGVLALLVGVAAHAPWLRRRPGVLHVLWIVVLLKFLMPAFIPVPLLPAEPAQPATDVTQHSPPPHEPLPVPQLEPQSAGVAVTPAPRVLAGSPAIELPSLPQVFLAVWVVGTALILLRAAIRTLRLRRRVLESAYEDERLSRLLDICRRRMGISGAAEARVIDAHCSPFLFAAVGPARICIPRVMMEQFTDDQLIAVLSHELAHHVRRDVWTNLLAFIAAAAVWWNPLVWWARAQLCAAQELCCDAIVLSGNGASRRAYAEVLLSTLDLFDDAPPALLTAGWGSVRSLKARFHMIGDSNVIPRVSPAWVVVALLLGVAMLCVPSRAQPPAATVPATMEAGKSRTWKAQLIDGDTGKPLPGLRLHANAVVHTTNADGIAEVLIPEGAGAIVSLASQGWWSGDMNFLGGSFRAVDPNAPDVPADPNKPVQIKVWRGTTLTGRLLGPDTKPVPNAMLLVATYINNQTWKKRLGMSLDFNSWDHGDMPNWSYRFETDADGRFEITVPPDDARSWLRIGTADLFIANSYSTGLDPNGPAKALVNYAPFEKQIEATSIDGKLELGNLQLARGTVLRGRVVDVDGKPLAGVNLYTSGTRGPYYGRAAISGRDGSYQFLPMHPGPFTLSPYAQLKDAKGDVNSRDVQAVFVPQQINLAESEKPVELEVRAVPHITLEFEWIDRRAKKGPVSYYGDFAVHGQFKRDDGTTADWRSATELTSRDGRQILFVKVPRDVINPKLTLTADSVVTASYEDGQQKAGPGTIELQDIGQTRRRVIYGDGNGKRGTENGHRA